MLADEVGKNKTATNPPSSEVVQQHIRFGSMLTISNPILL